MQPVTLTDPSSIGGKFRSIHIYDAQFVREKEEKAIKNMWYLVFRRVDKHSGSELLRDHVAYASLSSSGGIYR